MANVKLVSRTLVAEGTMAFTFEKPEGFSFSPGQFIEIKLLNPPETDDEGNVRVFSLVSTPKDDTLTVATRLRDTAFKRVLAAMEPGTQVEISEAMGSFTLHKNAEKPAIFLMGGVGITPTMSIIKSATAQKLPHRLILFFSNRRPEDAPFLEELQELPQKNPNFTFIGTMTDMEKATQKWEGETGYITADMVRKYIPDDVRHNAIWYLSGPPGMVKAMQGVLRDLAVDEDNVRFEEFSGYATDRKPQEKPQ